MSSRSRAVPLSILGDTSASRVALACYTVFSLFPLPLLTILLLGFLLEADLPIAPIGLLGTGRRLLTQRNAIETDKGSS